MKLQLATALLIEAITAHGGFGGGGHGFGGGFRHGFHGHRPGLLGGIAGMPYPFPMAGPPPMGIVPFAPPPPAMVPVAGAYPPPIGVDGGVMGGMPMQQGGGIISGMPMQQGGGMPIGQGMGQPMMQMSNGGLGQAGAIDARASVSVNANGGIAMAPAQQMVIPQQQMVVPQQMAISAPQQQYVAASPMGLSASAAAMSQPQMVTSGRVLAAGADGLGIQVDGQSGAAPPAVAAPQPMPPTPAPTGGSGFSTKGFVRKHEEYQEQKSGSKDSSKEFGKTTVQI